MSSIRNEMQHEALYKSIHSLTKLRPPGNEELFKLLSKSMFVKINHTAFKEIAFYLLHTIDPAVVEEKLPRSFIHDSKLERKFRSAFIDSVKHINKTLPHACIPILQVSVLAAPGGDHIAFFLLQLANVALYEEIKRTDNVIMRFNKNIRDEDLLQNYIDTLGQATLQIEMDTQRKFKEFQQYEMDCDSNAKDISFKQLLVGEKISTLVKMYNIKNNEFNVKHETFHEVPLLLLEEMLTNKLKSVEIAARKLLECKKAIHAINNGTYLLKFDSNSLVYNEKTKCLLSTHKTNLDLIELFETFNVYLRELNIKLPICFENFVKEVNEKYDSFTQRFNGLLYEFTYLEDNHEKLQEEMQHVFQHVQLEESDSLKCLPLED